MLAASSVADPMHVLLNYGALGLILVLILFTDRLHTSGEVKRLERQNDEQREIIRRMQDQLQVHTLPALAKSAQVLEAVPHKESAVLEDVKSLQAEMAHLVSRLEAATEGRRPPEGRKRP